jgi:uncharacterized low-complexity protein
MKLLKKSSIVALSSALLLAVFASGSVKAETNPFSSHDLTTVSIAGGSGKCGEGKKTTKCGEGKMKKAHKAKCGEGKMKKAKAKCGEGKMKKAHKGKCGEGKMKKAKAKCGEGK